MRLVVTVFIIKYFLDKYQRNIYFIRPVYTILNVQIKYLYANSTWIYETKCYYEAILSKPFLQQYWFSYIVSDVVFLGIFIQDIKKKS